MAPISFRTEHCSGNPHFLKNERKDINSREKENYLSVAAISFISSPPTWETMMSNWICWISTSRMSDFKMSDFNKSGVGFWRVGCRMAPTSFRTKQSLGIQRSLGLTCTHCYLKNIFFNIFKDYSFHVYRQTRPPTPPTLPMRLLYSPMQMILWCDMESSKLWKLHFNDIKTICGIVYVSE